LQRGHLRGATDEHLKEPHFAMAVGGSSDGGRVTGRSCPCPSETSLPRLGLLFHFLSWRARLWPLSETSSRVVNSRVPHSSTSDVSGGNRTGLPAQSQSAFPRPVGSPSSRRLSRCGVSSTCFPPTARGHPALFHEWGKPRQSIIRLGRQTM